MDKKHFRMHTGAQVYIQVYDHDFTQNPQDDELVDSFSIDVQ